ncbi:hypothetical protein G6F40_017064 [Rhizopus arrhizus]|nr:hypothetical protein G6F23_014932 [Rhizopus arrhizus]KAG1077489.1 hypothetical protein G6F40_017064 [Rhizopus arrhizus]
MPAGRWPATRCFVARWTTSCSAWLHSCSDRLAPGGAATLGQWAGGVHGYRTGWCVGVDGCRGRLLAERAATGLLPASAVRVHRCGSGRGARPGTDYRTARHDRACGPVPRR